MDGVIGGELKKRHRKNIGLHGVSGCPGFMVINAESLDQAEGIARSSPIIKNGGYILARPCGEMK
jgi:hypothetical protein